MEMWVDFPWLEVLPASILLVCGLAGIVLLVNKSPAGQWLGLVLISSMVVVLTKSTDLNYLLPATLIFWFATVHLYVRAFFYQKHRTSSFHFFIIVFAWAINFVFDEYPIINWSVSGFLMLSYFMLILRRLLVESQSRGFSYFLNAGNRISWFRNFMLLTCLFAAFVFLPFGAWVYYILLLMLIVHVLSQLFRESAFLSPIPIGNKYKKSTLTPEIKSSIINRLDEVMNDHHFYRQNEASLTNLADLLGVTNHHLSQVLNESLKISFQDLLARYRIREACMLLRQDQNPMKIESIAASVGYNSKSAFNTAFKKRTGVTPSEYREAKEVLTYGEERLSERKVPSKTPLLVHLNHVFNLKIKQDMIHNFFKVFVRNIRRNRLFSMINVFGLTIGFVCCIFISLYIMHELSFDKNIPDYDRLYRITWMSGNSQTRTPHPMAQALKQDWPEVEAAVSLTPWYGPGLSKELVRVENPITNVLFEEPDFMFADSTFFNVFQLEILEGDADALSKPFSLVITSDMAKKYFGDSSAVGRELVLNDMPLAVTTVVAGMPENAHFHFNAIIPYMTLKQINPNDGWMEWEDFGHFNYLKLAEGTDPMELQEKLPDWTAGFLDWDEDALEALRKGVSGYFGLQPVGDIHLHSNLRWELEDNGNVLYIYILSATLVFLLVIVSINYANLTTAKSLERAKEIGVRKTLGAFTANLKWQFYLESIAICLISLVFSLILTHAFLGSFNQLSGKSFDSSDILTPYFLAQHILLAIIIGLVAGFYPAIALSSFKPTEVLKGKLTTSAQGIRLRSALVVLQFTVSAILIAGSLVIYQQINYMKNKEMGFDREAVISFDIPVSIELGGIDLPKIYSVRQQIESIPGVISTSMMSNLPGGQFNQHDVYVASDPENNLDFSEVMVDYDFDQVLGIELRAGRSFERSSGDTTNLHFIINEAAANQLQLEEPIGEKLVWVDNESSFEGEVIGVTKDFHYRSLHEPIQPLIMFLQPLGAGHVIVKLEGNQFTEVLNQIEAIHAQLETDLPFDYQFLDQQIASLYRSEEQTLGIFSSFSIIAICLACLGLLGMAIAILNQRVKEVGMRKILGATSMSIMKMVLGQFVRLIVIALLIGLPIAYILMQSWMSEFSYQVPFNLTPFIWASLLLLIISILCVLSAITKISFSNPVDALRYE